MREGFIVTYPEQHRLLVGRPRRRSIADVIRREILTGRLRPGQWIRVKDLADRFGVSVTPVREGLLSLADEGMLEIQSRKGVRISRLSEVDMEDVAGIYAIIAGLLTERAASHISEEDLAELERMMRALEVEPDPHKQEELTWIFHRIINRQSGSVYLRSVARTLAWARPFGFYSLIPEWKTTAQADHMAIWLALKRRDPVASRLLTEEHIRKSGKAMVSYLHKIGYWDEDRPK